MKAREDGNVVFPLGTKKERIHLLKKRIYFGRDNYQLVTE
jgi:hypothetical protein